MSQGVAADSCLPKTAWPPTLDAGLRGYQTGGAQVSEKHCGFVINKDNATAADVCRLLRDVQDKVKEQFGVTLEPEVKFLGKF